MKRILLLAAGGAWLAAGCGGPPATVNAPAAVGSHEYRLPAPPGNQGAGRPDPAPAARKPVAATPVAEDAGRLDPVTRTPIGPNVELEVVRSPGEAVGLVLGQGLAAAGQVAGLSGAPAVVPRQPVHWLPHRDGSARRVLVRAEVCLTRGYLEHLLSIKAAGKAHESILEGDFDARHIHAALLAAGATPGRPAQFLNARREPEFKPPSGETIQVLLQYPDGDKLVTVPAQSWVRDHKTQKTLAYDWVFAGSVLIEDPAGERPPFYGANEGRVICTSNFPTALLDLPIQSEAGDPQQGLDWEANPPAIPPRRTPVTVILEPAGKR
jgi:hypothetical protein